MVYTTCVIGYGSWTLNTAEKNYRMTSGELEFLALKSAMTEHFRDYMYLYYSNHTTLYCIVGTQKLSYTECSFNLIAGVYSHIHLIEFTQLKVVHVSLF